MFFHQVALSRVKKSDSQEREMARQRDHQQLIDMIAGLREEKALIKETCHCFVPA
jgi:hypothetical protein